MNFFIILSAFVMTVQSGKFSAHLPMEALPSFYDIKLNIKLEGVFKFYGDSSITITVPKPTQILTLHAQYLEIESSANLTLDGNPTVIGTLSPIDNKTDFVKIMLDKALIPEQTYVLHLKYSGDIDTDPFGIFRTSYINSLGQQEWLVATQFEPTRARLVFPCWDEPSIKANFKLSITCDKKYSVMSNTQPMMTYTNPADIQQNTTVFTTTPKMSTYLIAFVIGNFDTERSKAQPRLQLITRAGLVGYGLYALNFGERALKELETYTNVNYTVGNKKLDFVALPEMSAAGMENWGLITFKENEFFVANDTSAVRRERAATLVAHELAHQWFGNLVTCQWWAYTWLNEGFAAYFQYIITDKLEPTWRMMDKIVVETLQMKAFMVDSRVTSHALNANINNPDEIVPVFGPVSYRKGSAVIRMISHVVGEDKFKTAIQQYLKANKFSAVNPLQLFKELSKVTPLPNFTAILKNWVTTPGFPVVTVLRNYTTNKATISQSRFLYKKDDLEKTYYHVPINYVSEDKLNFDDTTPTTWLPASNKPLVIDNLPKDKFLLFNKQQFGYYRVNYDNETWKLITNFMLQNSSKIHVLNRAQLIDDSFNLARAGKLDYSVPLSLAKYLKEETDYIPWISVFHSVSYVDKMLANSPSSNEFRSFMLVLMDKMLKTVGFEEQPNDDHVTMIKRSSAVWWSCTFGSKACLDYARKIFDKWLTDPKGNLLSQNLKPSILCFGLRNSDEATWTNVLNKYFTGKDRNLLNALSCSENENALKTLVNLALNASITAKNSDLIFHSIYTNSNKGRTIALNFIVANFKKLVNKYEEDYKRVENHLQNIVSAVTTQADLNTIKEFIKKHEKTHPMPNIALTNAENNLNWIKRNELKFLEFFKQKIPSRRRLNIIHNTTNNKNYQRENFSVSIKGKYFSFNFISNLTSIISQE